jgi:hypothetical protein
MAASIVFSSLLERAARQLPLNSPADVEIMRDTLERVVANIVANPLEQKFRSLKLQNKALRTKVFDLHGSAAAMSVLGFKRGISPDTSETAMVLHFNEAELKGAEPEAASASSSSAQALQASSFSSTALICLRFLICTHQNSRDMNLSATAGGVELAEPAA